MLCCTIVALVTAFSAALLYYSFYSSAAKAEIRTNTALMAAAINGQSDILTQTGNYARLLPANFRVSLVESDGKVLYDTDASIETLENHAHRAEIVSAMDVGSGEAVRFSDSIRKEAYYYAVRLSDGSVLRLSVPLNSLASVFLHTIPYLLLLVLILLFVSLGVSRWLTRRVVEPINSTAMRLEELLKGDAIPAEAEYEELSPFVRKIKALHQEIKEYVQTLQANQETINTLIQNMQEGLILLDGSNRILNISKSAVSLLAANPRVQYTGKNLLELLRSQPLLDSIRETDETHRGTSFMEKRDGRYYRYFISPAKSSGVFIFITDATSEVKAETIRREFASNVSHELKTPLTAITGFTELMENGMVSGNDLKSAATIIHREASRLITLIDDILRLSQIENATGTKEFTPVPLKAVTEEAAESLRPAAESRQITLSTFFEEDSITVPGNRTMLYELIYNLLDNAIKYNVDKGSVSISVRREEDSIAIRVADTGIGIPHDHLDRIFERFYRVDKSRSKATGGTGLGLSIVKHAVEYHGGRLSVNSTEGIGTEITVLLPSDLPGASEPI